MGLDPSIILGVRPLQIDSPLDVYGRKVAIEGVQQANALRAQQMDAYAQAQERQRGLNALLSRGDLSSPDLERTLLQGGYLNEARQIAEDRRKNAKTDADTAETRAKTDKLTIEQRIMKGDRLANMFRLAKDQQSWDTIRGLLPQVDPDISDEALARLPQQFDPNFVAMSLQRMVPQLDALREQRQADNELIGRGPDGQPRIQPLPLEARKQVAAAGVQQTPVQIVQTQSGPAMVPGRVPTGAKSVDVIPLNDPTQRAPGQPAPRAQMVNPDGKGTEGERAAAGFLGRMNAAEVLIGQNPKGRSTELTSAAAALPLVGPYVERRSMTPEQQRFKQAADDWIRAKLRKESGAVIGEAEMAAEYMTYFPQPGDDATVVEQKRQARAQAVRQMEIGAGPLTRQATPSAARPAQPAPASGEFVIRSVRPAGGP